MPYMLEFSNNSFRIKKTQTLNKLFRMFRTKSDLVRFYINLIDKDGGVEFKIVIHQECAKYNLKTNTFIERLDVFLQQYKQTNPEWCI